MFIKWFLYANIIVVNKVFLQGRCSMAKPSIFSRDYEKIMRKRKKRRNIIVMVF